MGSLWLAIIDSYISCRVGNITIKNGNFSKHLVLYPLAQPYIEHDLPFWLEEEEEDELYYTTPHPICTLDIITGGGMLRNQC
jgi:hypothetical protein